MRVMDYRAADQTQKSPEEHKNGLSPKSTKIARNDPPRPKLDVGTGASNRPRPKTHQKRPANGKIVKTARGSPANQHKTHQKSPKITKTPEIAHERDKMHLQSKK